MFPGRTKNKFLFRVMEKRLTKTIKISTINDKLVTTRRQGQIGKFSQISYSLVFDKCFTREKTYQHKKRAT